ncbi:amidohydrolase [Enterovirga sp. DB1703]|uniref:Amidohydrolase n=2 Tax=Enterovirga aerilata TaxID=2730920 RepID=A0A849I5B9_9HYPH|nr:amidohydrolase [Enterovirga sp. DB1703]
MLGYPDLLLVNARIVTADPGFSIAEALAIRGDRFLAVGRTQDIVSLAGPDTQVIDLAGRTVLPGLIDTHAHVERAGLLGSTVGFEGVSSIDEALARVRERADRTPAGEWIRGRIWHPLAQLREKRFLTRWELDRAAPDHPVILPVSHFSLVNSRALALAGITRDTPDPDGGEIHRDAAGEPTGVLEEAAEELVERLLPPWSFDQQVAQMKDAMAYFNSFGLTSAISAAVSPGDLRVHQALRASGQATLRISAMFAPTGGLNPTLSLDEWELFFARIGVASDFGDEWLSLSGVKLQVDGGMTLRTAAMRAGYPDDPDYRGTVVIPQDRLNGFVSIANRYGWRVGIHAVGDAAVDAVLDAYEAADRERSIRDRRFVVIHGSLMQPDQMVRARDLGVRVDAQSAFLWDKAAAIARHVGKETADRAIPMRSLIDTMGLDLLGQGTDYPINPLNPFFNIYVMTTRRDATGTVYGPSEAITREEAIRLYTSAAARYSFSEHRTGSIEPGKLADLAVLSADILGVSDEELKEIRVVRTIVGGRTVFESP